MTNRNRWVRAVRCADIPPREGRSVVLAGREIAIFNLGDRFLAVDNRCPHKAGPLAEGIVAGTAVVCPLHAWKVDLETGAVTRPTLESSCVQAYPLRVVDGVIQIHVPLRSPERFSPSVPCSEEKPLSPWSVAAESIGELAP